LHAIVAKFRTSHITQSTWVNMAIKLHFGCVFENVAMSHRCRLCSRSRVYDFNSVDYWPNSIIFALL